MKTYLTYDDVNIVPRYSELESRDKVDLTTRFTKNTVLSIPIVASPMDTICGIDMAKEMLEWGGVGVIHRFQSIDEQARMMRLLHYEWDRYFTPLSGNDNEEERTIDKEWNEWWDSVRGWNHPPTKSDWEDLKDRFYWTDSLIRDEKIWKKRPRCAAIGVTGDYKERAQELVKNGCNVLLIDIAHGHHVLLKNVIKELKDEFGRDVEIVGGSIATKEAAKDLCEWGVDALRVGIGNGSLCETRIRTGVGLPQVTALLDVCSVADGYGVPVIADGGVRNVGDVCKGLGCGADSVMLGSLLAGTKETPGDIHKVGEWPNERLYKKYRGSASLDSKSDRGESKNVEGNSKIIPYKGKVTRIIFDIRDGISSSCSYVGARDLLDFQSRCKLVQVTQAGAVEAKPHLL
jgi:IMP dehydrogenase